MSLSISPAGSASSDSEDSLALQGHAKRYMRINEYLFHGTQKKTAIVQLTLDSHRHHV